MELNNFCNFINTSQSANEKFEALLYDYENAHKRWQEKGYFSQKNGVIVASKSDNNGFSDCSDIIMMVQYKDSNFLPLETLETLNEQDMLNVVGNIEQSYVRKSQTVLRHSGDLRENSDGFYIQKDCYIPQQNIEKETIVNTENSTFLNATYNYNESNEIGKKKNNKTLVSVEDICKSMKTTRFEKPAKNKSAQNSTKFYSCSDCDKKFCKKASLNIHMAGHKNIRPYTCQLCSKSFVAQWKLRMHQRWHTGIYTCQFCSKTFPVKSKLQRHERIHTNVRPFTCTVSDCNRSFSDKSNLIAHQLTHTNVRSFVCDVCNKSYKTKCHLNDHKKAHDRAAFKCETCGVQYKWKANLLMHMKKHEGYICIYCKKNCGRLVALIKHRKICENRTK